VGAKIQKKPHPSLPGREDFNKMLKFEVSPTGGDLEGAVFLPFKINTNPHPPYFKINTIFEKQTYFISSP
jgi:hypothetical protein